MVRPRAAVCASRLVDPESSRVVSAQRWLYAVELTKLLCDLGYETVWYQLGSGWRSEVLPNAPLIAALPEESQLGFWPEASNAFWEKSGGADLAIYFDLPLAYPQAHEAAIAIAHGIEWNDPLFEVRLETEREREEWKRRTWMALLGVQRVVAADTGVIQWATATWPGLYNTFVHIPDFLPPAGVGAGPGAQPEEGEGPVRVLFWDALVPRSGIAQTLQAIEPLLDAHPELEFAVAGAGTPEANAFLARWAETHERTAFFPHGVPPEFLRGVSILLMPGKWGSAASHLCLQGMAAGAAVLVGQMSGLTDLVIHDYNGWVIKSTAEDIQKAVERLILRPEERRRLGANAREIAAHFTLERWRERWSQVIKQVGRGGVPCDT